MIESSSVMLAGAVPKALRRQEVLLRPETADDLSFLRRLYGDHRAEELARANWPIEARERFLDSQFDHQRAHFTTQFPDCDYMIVLRGRSAASARPVGRIYLDRAATVWHLVDISLDPAIRGKGIGAALIAWIKASAPAIELHVARDNPRAEALYRRLGFVEHMSTSATHKRMGWRRPAGA